MDNIAIREYGLTHWLQDLYIIIWK